MSTVPCSLHGETVYGKLMSLYVTVVKDGYKYKRKLYLCDNCLSHLQSSYGGNWSDGFILNRFGPSTTCAQCHEERGTNGTMHPMYATAYSQKGVRYDYFANYCESCSAVLIDTFGLTNGHS